MKNTLHHVSRAAALAVCVFAAGQARAEYLPTMSVSVPFDFVVSGKTLPAGNYSILSSTSRAGASIFVVRNRLTREGAFSIMGGRTWAKSTDPDTPQVVFACREEVCYLNELKIPGSDGFVVRLPNFSPAQRERQVALNAGYIVGGK